jgi:hypothetical protein
MLMLLACTYVAHACVCVDRASREGLLAWGWTLVPRHRWTDRRQHGDTPHAHRYASAAINLAQNRQAHRQPEIATACGALSLCFLAAVLVAVLLRLLLPVSISRLVSSDLVSLLSSLDYDDGETYRHDLSEAAWRLLNKH